MDSYVQTVELDEDLNDYHMAKKSIAAESKVKPKWRKSQLKLLAQFLTQLLEVLTAYHYVFCLEYGKSNLLSTQDIHFKKGGGTEDNSWSQAGDC